MVPVLGILGLIVMAIKSSWVLKQATGDKNMVELAGYIADGAMAFLRAEWKVLSTLLLLLLLFWRGRVCWSKLPTLRLQFHFSSAHFFLLLQDTSE